MRTINIMILSAGRRVELIEAFKNAAQKLNISSNIIAVDASALAPALYFANKHYIIPKVNSEDYLPALINICNIENIDLVIPTIDAELLTLSKHKEYIESKINGIIMISKFENVLICRDKFKTHDTLKKLGFNVPYIYSEKEIVEGDVKFPAFIKPKSGSSSINAFKVNNSKELELYLKVIPDYMVQEYLEGEEYTVDIFNDFHGNTVSIVPRLRISTRAGEILQGKIVKNKLIIETVQRLLKQISFIGHITVQLKLFNQKIHFIEINPRFGGGAPMSIQAGANSCEFLYRLLNQEKLEYFEDYKEMYFLRFDSSLGLEEENIK